MCLTHTHTKIQREKWRHEKRKWSNFSTTTTIFFCTFFLLRFHFSFWLSLINFKNITKYFFHLSSELSLDSHPSVTSSQISTHKVEQITHLMWNSSSQSCVKMYFFFFFFDFYDFSHLWSLIFLCFVILWGWIDK